MATPDAYERLTGKEQEEVKVYLRNCSDLMSIMQTAKGAMQEATNILCRLRDLGEQSSHSSNSHSDRIAIQQEFTYLRNELLRVAETTSFGINIKLLDGTFSKSFLIDESSNVVLTLGNIRPDSLEMGGKIYVAEKVASPDWVVTSSTDLTLKYIAKLGGAKSITIHARQGDHPKDVAAYISGQTTDIKAFVGEDGRLQLFTSTQTVDGEITVGGGLGSEMGLGEARDVCVADVDVSTIGGSRQAMVVVDSAIKAVDSQSSSLSPLIDSVDHAIYNLSNITGNGKADSSKIKDTDFAKETSKLTKSQILAQASALILAHAKKPPFALSLLQ